jgi:hypothetical protein
MEMFRKSVQFIKNKLFIHNILQLYYFSLDSFIFILFSLGYIKIGKNYVKISYISSSAKHASVSNILTSDCNNSKYNQIKISLS